MRDKTKRDLNTYIKTEFSKLLKRIYYLNGDEIKSMFGN